MSAALWVLVLLPAAAGGVLTCTAGGRDRTGGRSAAPVVAVAVAAAVLVLAVACAVVRPSGRVPFLPAGGGLGLAVDGLSAVVTVTVAAVTLAVLLFAAADVRTGRPRFFGLMLVFEAAVLLTVTATTLPALLLAWEVMGATSFALIAHRWREDAPVAAGTTAFLVTRTGDLGLYLAAGAALAGGAGLSLTGLSSTDGVWLHVAAAGVLAAALGKAAQLPFSFWLSKAMLGPSPVSALLHSAAMVAMGGYLLLRLRPLLEAAGWAADAAAWAGALTALVLGAVALFLRDLKQVLAASTCAQLGFVVMAAGVGAVAGGTAHFAAHAAVKSLLFLCAGAWLSAHGTQQLPELRAAGVRRGPVGAVFAVGALALAGVPPLSLWATKDEILAATGSPGLYAVALVAGLLSALYAGRALGLLLRPPPEPPSAPHRFPAAQTVPLLVLAGAGAVLGVLALPPYADRFKDLLGVPGEPSAGVDTLLLSAGVALLGTAAAARWAPRIPEPAWARSWLGLERAAHTLLVRPVLRLAHLAARFDDAVLARSVLATAAGARRLAGWTRTADDAGLDAAVRRTAAGARRLGDLARRPQTGQLHHYYAQAVVALAATGLLLLLLLR